MNKAFYWIYAVVKLDLENCNTLFLTYDYSIIFIALT